MSLSTRLRDTKKIAHQPGAMVAKADIRRRVLAGVTPSHVLDVFAGDGGMYRRAWREADSYTAMDRKWFRDDRRAYVGDSLLMLRGIDLNAFTIFDVDSYGSPWPAAWTIAKLRRWDRPETIGFVLTYGSGFKIKFGQVPVVEAAMAGMEHVGFAARDILLDNCLSAWLRQVGGTVLRRWQATAGNGQSGMIYTGLVISIAPRGPS